MRPSLHGFILWAGADRSEKWAGTSFVSYCAETAGHAEWSRTGMTDF